MALVSLEKPDLYSCEPTYNPIPHVYIDAVNGSNANAHVDIDIRLGNPDNKVLFSNHKIRFDIDDIAQIDVHRIISTQISESLDPTNLKTFQLSNKSWAYCSVDATTYVDGSATGSTLTSNFIAWNGVFNWDNLIDFKTGSNWRRYYGGGISATDKGEFMTNLPQNTEVELDDYIYFQHRSTNGLPDNHYLQVVTDNGSYRILSHIVTNTAQKEVCSIGVGPYNLLNADTSGGGMIHIDSGSLPMLDENSTSYTVQTLNSSNQINSELFTFQIKETQCSKFENYRLLYLDRLGSYVTVNFSLLSKKNTNVKRNTYRQKLGGYTTEKGKWMYGMDDRSLRTIDTNIDEKIKITSNWVSEEIGDSIIELLQSPSVFHIDSNNNFRGIQILTNGLETKTRINNQIFNYSLEFEYSNKNNTQNI